MVSDRSEVPAPLEEGFLPAGELVDRLVDGTVEAAKAWPAARCSHRYARLVCSAHTGAGVMCLDCSIKHHAGHGMRLDQTCDSCAELTVDTRKAWCQVGPFWALIRLCEACRRRGGTG